MTRGIRSATVAVLLGSTLVAAATAAGADTRDDLTDATDPESLAATIDEVPEQYLTDPDGTGFRLDLHGSVEQLAGDDLLYGVEPEEILLGADVFFEFDEAELTDAAVTALEELADDIGGRADASGAMQIVGHTDDVGDPAYNQGLSEERAQAVADHLRDALDLGGVDVAVEGRGEDEPIAPNATEEGEDNPEGRARNRRVELTFEGGS